MMAFALAARERCEARQAAGKLSRSAGEAYANTLVPLMDCVTLAATFAKDKLVVCNTQRNAVLAFNVFTFSAPDSIQGPWAPGSPSSSPILRDVTLSVDKTTVVSAEVFQAVQATVATINRVLCQLVPGLSIEVRQLHDETLDCGAAGKRIEVLSRRGEVVVPFRTESEGIKKIVSMLGWLIDVYNDDSSCLVVDEIDSGVFEFLLGELLEVVSQRGRGQLIFTAHNLRALECLPSGCLVFTTVNPQNRYIRFRGSGASNNLRNQYLRAINLGGQGAGVPAHQQRGHRCCVLWRRLFCGRGPGGLRRSSEPACRGRGAAGSGGRGGRRRAGGGCGDRCGASDGRVCGRCCRFDGGRGVCRCRGRRRFRGAP